MDGLSKPDLAQQIAGALDWWREAGVDADFTAEPQRWLAEPEAREAEIAPALARPEPQLAPPPAVPAEPLPADLAEFTAWWLSDTATIPGDPSNRVSPRGAAGAKTMILVATPEREDSGHLMSGSQGRLLGGICGALGWEAEGTYVASALPYHDPVPDWPALAATRLGEIALQHVSLVAPERLLILGTNVLSLIGHDMAKKPRFLPDINHEPRKFPVLAELDLAALLAQPRLKAGLWGRLLEWTGNQGS